MGAKVRKAVIPAAGFGTRFLPQTKSSPKEMLPIVDKPIIQHVVEDAVAAGIEDIIIVTGSNKRAIEDHFDISRELEDWLKDQGKIDQFEQIHQIAQMANFIYVRQKGPYGNATPVLDTKHLIGDEPFLVLWGDDFIEATPSRSAQLIAAYEKYGSSALSGIRTSKKEDTNKYGYAGGQEVEPGIIKMDTYIEKPGPDNAPSDLAIVSGYLLTPDIFHVLDHLQPGKSGELWLVDAINQLMKEKEVLAVEIKNGKYYDTGNKLEYVKANIDFALKRDDFNQDLITYIKEIAAKN
jgi:UTP--glucose-1-phosphate uridylyltransferase